MDDRAELPWDEPTTGCTEFVRWKSDNTWLTITPWSKLDTLALSLLRRILEPNSVKRITLDKLIEHKWCAAKSIEGKAIVHSYTIIISIRIHILYIYIYYDVLNESKETTYIFTTINIVYSNILYDTIRALSIRSYFIIVL